MYQMWRWKIGSVSCTQCDKWSFINIKDDWECIIFKVRYFSNILGSTFFKKCPEEMKSSLDFIVSENEIINYIEKEIEIKDQDNKNNCGLYVYQF